MTMMMMMIMMMMMMIIIIIIIIIIPVKLVCGRTGNERSLFSDVRALLRSRQFAVK